MSQDKFVERVIEWLKLDDKIKHTMEKVKELKEEKKEMEAYILKHMDDMDEKVITISSGKLRKNTSKCKGAIKQEHIEKTLNDYINKPDETKKVMDEIMNCRPVTERTYLKRCRKRNGKSD